MKPARQAPAFERDPDRLDAVVGEPRIARVTVSLALVQGDVLVVVVVIRPLRGAPMHRRHEVAVARSDGPALLLGRFGPRFAPLCRRGERRRDVRVLLNALLDQREISAGFHAARELQVFRARLVPIRPVGLDDVVEHPALLLPAPDLWLTAARAQIGWSLLAHIGLLLWGRRVFYHNLKRIHEARRHLTVALALDEHPTVHDLSRHNTDL
jgi:hypothetical protein